MVAEQGNLLEARKRPVLKGFAKFDIEKFERELERFKKDCQNAGMSRAFLNLNSMISTFLTEDQIEYIKDDLMKEELSEEDIKLFFQDIKENSKERFLDVVKLLETVKLRFNSSEIAAMSTFIMFCKTRLRANNVDVKHISPMNKEGRINLFKVLGAKLSKKNNEQFMFWLKQTKNEAGKLYIKDPDYKICKAEYLRLLREDFKNLQGKLKPGSFINYGSQSKDRPYGLGSPEDAKRPQKTAKRVAAVQAQSDRVKRSKRGTVLTCWECRGNHSMKECPKIPQNERLQRWKTEFAKRKEEWKAKKNTKRTD